MKTLKILSAVIAVLMVVACLASCGATEPKDEGAKAFKLGGIGPLTGGAAIYGTAALNGAKIAVDEINALGGDIQFEWQAEDDVHDPETSLNAYNTLLDWGAQMIVGTVTTGPCITVSAQANEDRVFMITPSASSTDVLKDKDQTFQICFTDPNQGVGSADYMAENFADEVIGVIYKSDDAYSSGIYETFIAEAEVKKLNVAYTDAFTEATSTDFSTQIKGAQAAGVTVLYLPMYYQPISIIMQQAKDIGYAPVYFGVDGMDGLLTVEGFDTSLAEGAYLLTPFSADADDDMTKSFVAKYQELYNEVPNQFAADGYDTVYTFKAALEKAGCTADMSAEEICEALIGVMTDITVDGLTGEGMTWAATGEVSKAPRAVIIKDGIYVTPGK